GQLERSGVDPDQYEPPPGAQPVDQLGHRLRGRCRADDRVHTAERLQRRARRRGVAVEVMVRSQAMRGLLPLRAAGDGYDLMAHGGRELDGEMTDPPDPEDRDTAAARRACRPDGVDRG